MTRLIVISGNVEQWRDNVNVLLTLNTARCIPVFI